MAFADNQALLDMAKPMAKKAYDKCFASDPAGPLIVTELALLEAGYINGTSGMGDATLVENESKAKMAYRVAYNLILGAMDIARGKIEEAEAEGTRVKFRKEYEYFKLMLKRYAVRAGINDDESPDCLPPNDVLGIPFC